MGLMANLRRTLYGAPRPHNVGGARVGGGPGLWTRHLFLPIATIPFLLGLLGLLLIEAVVDPYDIRPWGLAPKLADHRYPDVEWPLLLKVVTRQQHELVMIGASTLMPVSHDDLVATFGAATHPVNLAYPYAAPRDTRVVVDAVTAMPSLKRVLFVMDHSQMMSMAERRVPAQLREQVFASDWAHAGDFRWDTLVASWHRVADGVYDMPAWHDLKEPEFFNLFSPVSEQPRTLERMRGAIAKHRGDVFGKGIDPDCGRYPFLFAVLAPALDKFRARGVQVDLVFPPYPYAGYYDWVDHRTSNDPFYPGPVFPQLMGFKRCVVDIADRFGPGVTVHAMDNDAVIAGQIGNYADDVHIIRPALFSLILGHIAHHNSMLTKANFDHFDRDLRAHIISYRAP
jgi:hypothetical protein